MNVNIYAGSGDATSEQGIWHHTGSRKNSPEPSWDVSAIITGAITVITMIMIIACRLAYAAVRSVGEEKLRRPNEEGWRRRCLPGYLGFRVWGLGFRV